METFECIFPKPGEGRGSEVTELPKDPMSFFPHMSKEDREKFEKELDDYMTKCIQEEQDRTEEERTWTTERMRQHLENEGILIYENPWKSQDRQVHYCPPQKMNSGFYYAPNIPEEFQDKEGDL